MAIPLIIIIESYLQILSGLNCLSVKRKPLVLSEVISMLSWRFIHFIYYYYFNLVFLSFQHKVYLYRKGKVYLPLSGLWFVLNSATVSYKFSNSVWCNDYYRQRRIILLWLFLSVYFILAEKYVCVCVEQCFDIVIVVYDIVCCVSLLSFSFYIS